MTDIYVDATTLIALGSIGELELLTRFEGNVMVVPEVRSEVTTQPADSALERFIATGAFETRESVEQGATERAKDLLQVEALTADVRLVAELLNSQSTDRPVALISDDRRLRTLAGGLGVPITGTIGVVVRAVEEGLDPDEAKTLVRRLDSRGLHMTGELRETAFDLIDDAAQ